ncbi:NADPH-dependent FMN reductase [Vreelandella subglaciescola]|jgi:chromate reductase|uniref:Chromate reductase n=1 Tax=Vreelandella subglaciescola TaxID=29571 RepID=A0A1M7IHX4_9GAMM|nr:NADPH-dependent FMN reductase [Halomonas subglaciescola]SHM40275.1 chromate reductase [Halomonas subglaciescola]
MSKTTIAMLVGSLREGSLNARLARAVEKLSPETIAFEWVDIGSMPFYNGDLEGQRPESVTAFTAAIKRADGVCMVTPEYNRSISAVLKNAIDWGSKPVDDNVWRDKPIGMAGTSPGALGTALAQQHLRQILAIQGAYVMPGEVYLSFKPNTLITPTGEITEDSVEEFVGDFAQRLAAYVENHATSLASRPERV